MAIKELVRDNYVKTQQVGSLVEKFHVSHRYIGVISDVLNDRISSLPTEKHVAFAASPGTADVIITKQEETLVFQAEPIAFAALPSAADVIITKQEEALVFQAEPIAFAALPSAANFIGFGREAEPVVYLNWRDTAYPILWREIKDQVEVYPGYWVSSEEYERRFKGVNLDYFRKALPTELFKAYANNMGSIEGAGIEPQHRYRGKD